MTTELTDLNPLTGREAECLRWASEGKTSWEIGQILGLSERTVNYHIRNACTKMNVRSRQAAIAHALLSGYLPPGNQRHPEPEPPRMSSILEVA